MNLSQVQKNIFGIKISMLFFLTLIIISSYAQTGLNFQGVARNNNNVVIASQQISVRLSILQGSASGIAEYTETRTLTTNAQGLFTVVIGDVGATMSVGNFGTINWKNTPKYLKIEMDAIGGNNFITMGTTQFQYVAYAQFANSVDAENISGIVSVTRGGTGTTSLSDLKSNLEIDKINNTADADKPVSAKMLSALELKLNITDTGLYTKKNWVTNALVDKLNVTDTAVMLSSRITRDTASLSSRINDKANSSDVNVNLALKASTTNLTSGLALKENISNKSTAVDLGGISPSDILFPTQKAVKDYVAANNSAGGVADGGITTIKLADGAVTDAKINTVSGSKVIGNITGNAATATLATNATLAGNITATTNTTLTSLSNLNTIGTIITGTWSGTKVAIANGGTGLTAPGTAGQVLTSTSSGTLIWKSTSKLLSIGDAYQGGIIAYILQDGDPGFDATNQKGLIAATSDQSTGIQWYNSTYTTTGATGTAIGTGLSNTNTIIASHGGIATSYAAGVARAYTGGGYTDWYLPSKDELDKLFINREAIGGFATNFYWSSSEIDNDKAYSRIFSYSLLLNYYFKYHPFYVRAIRAFSSVKSIEDGGTGATTASAARANLGLVIGANVQAPLVAGTNYIVPNISITGATKTKLTYDTKGLVIEGTDATTADITSSTNKNYVTDVQSGVLSNTSGTNTGDQIIKLTGDVTGTGTGTFTSTLANSGVSASSYGSSTSIPIFTVDAKGRITTASTASIVADAGTLTGTVAIANGGTGTSSVAVNTIFAGPSTINGAPSFRTLTASDIPSNLTGYIQNAPSATQTGTININGLVKAAGIDLMMGNNNFAVGIGALISITYGNNNSAVGRNALNNNKDGYNNSAFGLSALEKNNASQNNAFGTLALSKNIYGAQNSAFGSFTLQNNYDGTSNSAFGSNSLAENTSGSYNSALGYISLSRNTTGNFNNAFGYKALYNNINGNYNSAIGVESLYSNTGGSNNNANGYASMRSNTTGFNNNAFGNYSMYLNSSGYNNSVFGQEALRLNSSGAANSAFGAGAMYNNTTADFNSAFGAAALYTNTSGIANAAFGNKALYASTTGYDNAAFGSQSMFLNTEGIGNAAIGVMSLQNNTTGSGNTAVGKLALGSNLTGSYNVAIGFGADLDGGAYTNAIAIGYGAIASGSNIVQLGNSDITNVNTSGSITAGGGLTLNSTTQGFLPPRMTVAQRNAIATPVSGLVVWCNNCGPVGELQVFSENATWTNMSGTVAAAVYTPSIGAAYQGGKVAYILAGSDPGYDPNTPHGLIAAISDQSTGIQWYNGINTSTGATATVIGTGLANTNAIIASQGSTATNYAAGLATDYKRGGYTDWYLPSQNELVILFSNRVAIGGFSDTYYWSSSDLGSDIAYARSLYFGTGGQQANSKDSNYHVRAIRAF